MAVREQKEFIPGVLAEPNMRHWKLQQSLAIFVTNGTVQGNWKLMLTSLNFSIAWRSLIIFGKITRLGGYGV